MLNADDCLVTEYISTNSVIQQFYPNTPNILRVQIFRSKNKDAKITGSFMRFGNSGSGVIELPTGNGVFSKVDIENGKVECAYIIRNSCFEIISYHPDTKCDFLFKVPHWYFLVKDLIAVSDYVPQLKWIGFDVIITEESFKIIERISLSLATLLFTCYPPMHDTYVRELFLKKFLSRPKVFKKALKNLL